MSNTILLCGQIVNIARADCESPEHYTDDDFDAVELCALTTGDREYAAAQRELDVDVWRGEEQIGFGWIAPSGEINEDGGFSFWVYLQEPTMTDRLGMGNILDLRCIDDAAGEDGAKK